MKRVIVALAAAGAFAVPALAVAQNSTDSSYGGVNQQRHNVSGTMQSQVRQPSASVDEVKKHLSEIDLYVSQAENNARLLFQVSDLQPGNMDPVIIREDVQNIEQSLSQAERHLDHVRQLPNANIRNLPRLDQLQTDLAQARSQLSSVRGTLANADRAMLRDTSQRLFRTLRRADDDFSSIASQVGLVRVEQIPVTERQPVRGIDRDRDSGFERDLDIQSPELKGRGLDEGFGNTNTTPDRPIPSPSTPEQGAYPRY